MLDKLELRTNERINCNDLNACFKNHEIRFMRDPLYRTCMTIGKNGSQLITIKTNPLWGVHESKIVLNPTKYESFMNLTTLVSKIIDPKELEITRIDHAVDIQRPLDQLLSGVLIKNKKDNTTFKENFSSKGKFLTGSIFGQKPEVYCIYDKGYQLASKKYKRDNSHELGIITRIELRQFGAKVKNKHLSELTKYIESPPFHGIEYYEIDDDSPKAQALHYL